MNKLCLVELHGESIYGSESASTSVLVPEDYTDEQTFQVAFNKIIDNNLGCFHEGITAKEVDFYDTSNGSAVYYLYRCAHTNYKKALIEYNIQAYKAQIQELRRLLAMAETELEKYD